METTNKPYKSLCAIQVVAGDSAVNIHCDVTDELVALFSEYGEATKYDEYVLLFIGPRFDPQETMRYLFEIVVGRFPRPDEIENSRVIREKPEPPAEQEDDDFDPYRGDPINSEGDDGAETN